MIVIGEGVYDAYGVGGCVPQRIVIRSNADIAALLYVCCDRTAYLNGQGLCYETEMALASLREAFYLFRKVPVIWQVRTIDPGHEYELTDGYRIVFVKNEGASYPGNVGYHPGILTQEIFRICIHYFKRSSPQKYHIALTLLRQALGWYEIRAARCRGTHIVGDHVDTLDEAPVCPICGHNQCHRNEHERLPGTHR